MLALTRQQNISKWYRPTSAASRVDVANSAYTDAVKYFDIELTNDERKRDWVRGHNSLEDLCLVVEQAKKKYETGSEKNKRVRKWLNNFASRVDYYGAVLDTLAQHHPEYVALAWGAMKFLLSGIINHSELVMELTQALTSIAEVLPRVRLSGALYPTEFMKDATSRVYAHIMLFLQKAVKWYTMGPARRAASAIFKPYALSYQETVDQIRICAGYVNDLAGAAGRAEVRDINITVEDHTEKLVGMDQRLEAIQVSMQKSEEQLLRILQTTKNGYDISCSIQLDLSDQKSRILDIQFSQILKLLGSGRSPEDVLQSCQSIAKRRQSWRSPGRESTFFVQRLGDFVSMAGSSMFIVEAGIRAEARTKDLAVEVTTLLQATSYTVLWYLSEPVATGRACTLNNVFRGLIFQALRYDPKIISSEASLGNIAHFQAEHTTAEWFDLTCLVLSKIPKCFVVVETEDLYRISDRDPTLTRQVLENFQRILDRVTHAGCVMKLLVVSYGRGSSASLTVGDSPRIVARISQMLPVSRRLKQQSNRRAGLGRHNFQPRLEAFERNTMSSR